MDEEAFEWLAPLRRRRRPARADGSRGRGRRLPSKGRALFGLGAPPRATSSSERSSSTTRRARSTSTSSRRSTSRCATRTSTPRSTGWPGCSRRARSRSTWRGASSASPPRTSASPTRGALRLALAAKEAVDFIGMPEGALALAQVAVYLALAPKSNALYTAYGEAVSDVRERPNEPPPLAIRNAPTRLMKETGYGKGYVYAHDQPRRPPASTACPTLSAGGTTTGPRAKERKRRSRSAPKRSGGCARSFGKRGVKLAPCSGSPFPPSSWRPSPAPRSRPSGSGTRGSWRSRAIPSRSTSGSRRQRTASPPRSSTGPPRSLSAGRRGTGTTLMLYLSHYDAKIAARRKGDALSGTTPASAPRASSRSRSTPRGRRPPLRR